MIIQGTPEWYAARLGHCTASRIADVTARTKTGYGASRATYMWQLIAERLTGVPQEGYTNAAMQWGLDNEAAARAAYAFRMDVEITEVGYIPHPRIAMSGASPDGFVLDYGLVEIKCPLSATHGETLLSETVPDKYVKQMQYQMACTNRGWCDYISFDPRLPEAMALFVKRVKRDDVVIAELEKEVRAFLAELDGKVASLEKKFGRRRAA